MKIQLEPEIKLPFINTSVSTDIFYLFLFVPVWWVIGLDQVIWPILTFWIFIRLLLKEKIILTKTTRFMLIFILVSFISSAFIVESYRILSFIRNFSAFSSVWFLTVCITNSIQDEKQIKKLLWSLAILSFFASLLGILSITNIFNPRFETPIKYLIPEGLKSFGLVTAIYSKGTSTIDYFAGQMIVRPHSFFIGCTTYGVALVVLIPLVYFLFIKTHRLKKLFLFVTLIQLLVNLAFNMSRGAILSLIIATVIYNYKKLNISRKYIIIFFVIVISSVIHIWPNFFTDIKSISNKIIESRGTWSQNERLIIYKATLQGLLKSPFFGYGTQRDLPEISYYPIGSHSGYLGILYRYGIIGFLFYILILFSIYRCTKIPRRAYFIDPFLAKFIGFSSIAFYGNILHQFIEEPDLDLITLHIIWLSFGLLITSHKLLVVKLKDYESTTKN